MTIISDKEEIQRQANKKYNILLSYFITSTHSSDSNHMTHVPHLFISSSTTSLLSKGEEYYLSNLLWNFHFKNESEGGDGHGN